MTVGSSPPSPEFRLSGGPFASLLPRPAAGCRILETKRGRDMINWLKSIFARPRPSGPPETIRLFRSTDRTLSQDSVTVAQDGWVVEAREGQTIRLFEVQAPQAEQCLITYRAKMKCEGLAGRAFLEMWCRLP